jgi:3-oxoacyl-[acyl-carrier-protein] synthase-1
MDGPLPKSDTVVVGVGARTSTGLTALQVALAVRAGKLLPRESHLIDKAGDPIGTCRLGSIADNVMGLDRLVELGAPAILQATHSWTALQRARGVEEALPLVLALPAADRPGVDPRLGVELLAALAERTGSIVAPERSVAVQQCRGGGALAVSKAIELLRAGQRAVLVGGLDSYFDPDVLEYLDAEFRLHSASCENGFIPGEAAAFLLVTRRSEAASLHRWGQILAAECQLEPRPYGHPDPCMALGMTLALKNAVAPVGATKRIRWLLTDVTNERHRVEEWAVSRLRAFRAIHDDAVHEQPLLRTGDLGAASTATLLVIACMGWHTGFAPGDVALVASHSDGRERGVVLASREPTA